jgi:hypothetical protein
LLLLLHLVFVVNRPKNYLFVVVFGCGVFCFGFWFLFLSNHIASYIIYPFAVQEEEEEEEPTRLHHIIITLSSSSSSRRRKPTRSSLTLLLLV